MESSNNTTKIIGALLAGAAIGGILGVLFAPDKGSETRKKIAGKTSDLSADLKEKFESLLESAKKEYYETKEKTGETVATEKA